MTLSRRRDDAGAEVVGALILFGLFVAVLAFLNATAVPAAGVAAEAEHFERTLSALNQLQSEAEGAASPTSAGATTFRSIDLGPATSAPKDLFSFFMATPARASGEIAFVANYGNLTLTHHHGGNPNPIVDIGSLTAPFPYGRLTLDPHPIFRPEGLIRLENGGLVTTTSETETMRFAPPVTVTVAGSSTHVGVRARVMNGTDFSVGGVAPVRTMLVTEAATLSSPANDNSRSVTLRIETDHGPAWGAYLNATSTAAGLASGSHFTTTVATGAPGALDVVTWTVDGLSAGNTNDIRLTTGLAIYQVSVS